MTGAPQKHSRPLSPHLQIYKPMLTMMMSIVHRITGVGLYFGMAFLAWWLLALASGPAHFGFVHGLLTSWFGQLVLFGFTWALIHHMLGGLRHFIWDLGYGFEACSREWLARLTIAGSVVLTAAIWAWALTRGIS